MIPQARLDIRPFACPLTWVKTRMALEELAEGDLLELLLPDGEPIENLPRMAEREGHAVLDRAPVPGGWRILLRKGRAASARPATWEV